MLGKLFRLATLVALLAAPTVQAAFFSSRAAFDAANPGLPVIDFEGVAPVGGFVQPVAGNFYPGVTLSDGTSDANNAIADQGLLRPTRSS